MKRKFDCWDCKKQFESDDKDWVECPYCHSDNVDYAKGHMLRYIFVVLLSLVLLATCMCVVKYVIDNWPSGNSDIGATEVIQKDTSLIKTQDEMKKRGIDIPPNVDIAEIEYDEESSSYNCTFVISNEPFCDYKINIVSYYGEKLIMSQSDPRFEGIPYSKDDGMYYVQLVSCSNDSLLHERSFGCFEKKRTVSKRWSASELEKILNSDTSLSDDPHISVHNKVVVLNKMDGDTSETGTLNDVQGLLQQCGLKAKVSSVEYDDDNAIVLTKLSIDYPSDWIVEDDY